MLSAHAWCSKGAAGIDAAGIDAADVRMQYVPPARTATLLKVTAVVTTTTIMLWLDAGTTDGTTDMGNAASAHSIEAGGGHTVAGTAAKSLACKQCTC